MDKDKYLDWLQSLDTEELIRLANDWGLQLATKITNQQNGLQVFEEFLVDYYSRIVVPGIEANHYDQMRGIV